MLKVPIHLDVNLTTQERPKTIEIIGVIKGSSKPPYVKG